MRWYHFIFAYMIILPLFGLAVLPETLLNNWIYTFIILCPIIGVCGIKYTPSNDDNSHKRSRGP